MVTSGNYQATGGSPSLSINVFCFITAPFRKIVNFPIKLLSVFQVHLFFQDQKLGAGCSRIWSVPQGNETICLLCRESLGMAFACGIARVNKHYGLFPYSSKSCWLNVWVNYKELRIYGYIILKILWLLHRYLPNFTFWVDFPFVILRFHKFYSAVPVWF